MNEVVNIQQIKNNYILKQLFSHINYKHILNLVKNSKKLQKRLGINIENYKNINDFPKYDYVKETKKIPRPGCPSPLFGVEIICTQILSILFFPYYLVYPILLVSIKGFSDDNIKEDYNKSSLKIIKIINICLFVFIAFYIGSIFLIIYLYIIDCFYDYGIKKILKYGLIIIINLIYFLFEGLVIWKLVLSYEIKNGGVRWFMVMDYIFLCLNFIYSAYIILLTIIYFASSGVGIDNQISCTLISFNRIKINEYQLPYNFHHFSKTERKNCILQYYNEFDCFITDKQIELINLINDLREEKNIQKLEIDKKIIMQNLIFENNSEIVLLKEKNIFKISNKKFVFKYPIGEFENKIRNKNSKIINILLKDNLNHIQIYNQGKNECIFIYDSNEPKESNPHRLNFISLDINSNNKNKNAEKEYIFIKKPTNFGPVFDSQREILNEKN